MPNHVCAADGSGGKICTVLCDPLAPTCPWGNASSCAVHDAELGVPTCAHRFGSCSGSGQSCEPCVDDRDCGAAYCTGSSFTGERFCIDLQATCECAAGEEFCFGGGCPVTPGGLQMNCVPEVENGAPSVCFGAATVPGDQTSQLGCWPAPP
jgi:hypothetical protein